METTRRQFLKISANLAVILGLGASAIPRITEALEQLSTGTAPVLWLQGLSCSGCSISLLNSENPSPAQLLTGHISLRFNSCLSCATGDVAMDIINGSIAQGGYFLAVEGSIPARMPEACMVGHEPITTQITRAARSAQAVIAIGSCASFGGIPAAENNPTGAMGVKRFLDEAQISTPVIALPGCPVHPDWLTGTIVHVLKFGIPPLDDKGRPVMFYSRLIHDQCPRFADYERQNFAERFSDEGCLFKLGCLGPNTHADCTLRLWNSGRNSCIKAGAPCIGCTSEEFAKSASFSFFRERERVAKEEADS